MSGPETPRERPAIPPEPGLDHTGEQTNPFADRVPSTDIRSPKLWARVSGILIAVIGGPSALWASGEYVARKAALIEAHEQRITQLEERRAIVDDMHRLGCLLCFDRRGPQTTKCGGLCERHRPWTSTEE